MPRFIATMDSSDFCAAFAPQTSQVHNATFQTRRPSMPRHAFRAANRLRRFFSASRILRRWPHGSLGVTRLNGKGSLTLRLTCLSDRASTVGSPLPPPVFLTDCRFLVSTNSFHFVSSIALLGAPKIPSFKGSQTGLKGTSNKPSGDNGHSHRLSHSPNRRNFAHTHGGKGSYLSPLIPSGTATSSSTALS